MERDGCELAPLAGGGLEVGRPRGGPRRRPRRPVREMFTLGPKHRLGYVPARHISPPHMHFAAEGPGSGPVRRSEGWGTPAKGTYESVFAARLHFFAITDDSIIIDSNCYWHIHVEGRCSLVGSGNCRS